MPAMGADQNIDLRRGIASTLDWWRAAGVDALIDEAPRNWLAAATAPETATPRDTKRGETVIARPPAPPLPDSLEAFNQWRISDAAADAHWGSVRLGAQGKADSGVMVLIDLPDRSDETAGMLISGPAGILFDRMLAAIGMDRASICLAPLAITRPATGRIPMESEADLARLALHHIGLVAPRRLLLIGNAASRAILGADAASLRGNLHAVNHKGATLKAVTSFHPRFLLERPAAKAEAWKDLQLLIGGIDA